MNRLREHRLLLVAAAVFVAMYVLAALLIEDPGRPPSRLRSDREDGALALRLWLEAGGYHVRELAGSTVDPGDLDVIFVLNPYAPYTLAEARALQEWVARGHTLIVAGSGTSVNAALAPYDVAVARSGARRMETALPAGPTLTDPPVSHLPVGWTYRVEPDRADVVVHLVIDGDPVLISLAEGQGTVWVSGTVDPFTNLGLAAEGSARLILNLLAEAPPGARIGFDESLHNVEEIPASFSAWLFAGAAGWGIALAGALTFVFLALRGRRFARAIPLPEERLRREPVEYIQAMANLLRRSGQRTHTLGHYRARFRRALAHHYAIDASLADPDLLRAVAARDPAADLGALGELLRLLARTRVSEAELVSIVKAADSWMGEQT